MTGFQLILFEEDGLLREGVPITDKKIVKKCMENVAHAHGAWKGHSSQTLVPMIAHLLKFRLVATPSIPSEDNKTRDCGPTQEPRPERGCFPMGCCALVVESTLATHRYRELLIKDPRWKAFRGIIAATLTSYMVTPEAPQQEVLCAEDQQVVIPRWEWGFADGLKADLAQTWTSPDVQEETLLETKHKQQVAAFAKPLLENAQKAVQFSIATLAFPLPHPKDKQKIQLTVIPAHYHQLQLMRQASGLLFPSSHERS